MKKFAIVDLETTGQTPSKGDRIIEIGIILLHNDQIVDQYSTLINPHMDIPPFISNLTGIHDEDVVNAPDFKDVAKKIAALFDDAYVVAHNVPFDLGFLNFELTNAGLKALFQPVIDTVELSRILIPQADGFKLNQLSNYLSLQHSDPHRALSDAYVTSKLLLFLLEKMNGLPYETLYQIYQLEPKLKSDLNLLIENRMNELSFTTEQRQDIEVFRGIAIKMENNNELNREVAVQSFGDLLDEIYNNQGSLAKEMTTYEERPGQRKMSETIYDAFKSKQHALIEAETGTGKSLAYLIPALFEAVKSKQRIVVSTHLIQLQSQLLEKEIPLLKKLLPFSFKIALIKGKQHYLSLNKFEKELLIGYHQDNYDIALTKAILLVWLTETVTGDIDEIQLPSSGEHFFRKVSVESEGTLDPKSPWFSRSFYQRVKSKAQKANLIITNHSLICTDITNDFSLLPSYKKLIIDEAHHLEETAAKHFGLKVDYVNIQYLLNSVGSMEVGNWLFNIIDSIKGDSELISKQGWEQLWNNTKMESDDLFRYIFGFVLDQHGNDIAVNDTGRYQLRVNDEIISTKKWQQIKEMVTRLTFQLRDMIYTLYRVLDLVEDDEQNYLNEEVITFTERLQQLIDDLEELFLQDNANHVRWIEIEAFGAKNAVFLYSEPINVSSLLSDSLFSQKESVVLTSATLTMKNSFRFIKERIGLSDKKVIEESIQSPYNYESQVQLLIPNDFPNVRYGNSDDFIYATCEAIYSLAEVTNGRMLVLFTSYEMLKKSYNMLKEFMISDDFMLIAQGVSSGSRSRLKKNFQTFDKAILLGTSSFWEGVDIPGSDLSCLMIVRLPFQPPNHPVYEAKSHFIENQNKNPFMELSLPNAVIRFKQGFGRLIRSSVDRGIVFICDDRIIKARYGKYFTESIPKVPISYESTQKLVQKAEDWL